jgi:hypothetical protein
MNELPFNAFAPKNETGDGVKIFCLTLLVISCLTHFLPKSCALQCPTSKVKATIILSKERDQNSNKSALGEWYTFL